jgi:anaerobic nitric oxide reductase transcription regulator
LGLGRVRISPDGLDVLCSYDWPGNVRELENVLSRAILKASSGLPRGATVLVDAVHLGSDLRNASKPRPELLPDPGAILENKQTLREAVDDFQRSLIRRAIRQNSGNWSAAARDLGMHRSNLHNLAARLGLREKIQKQDS